MCRFSLTLSESREFRLYRNGALAYSTVGDPLATVTRVNNCLGAVPGGSKAKPSYQHHLRGELQGYALYDYIRTPLEVEAHAGTAPPCPGRAARA